MEHPPLQRSNRKARRTALAGAALLLAFAGAARAETLRDALAQTYLTNPDLEAQRAALRATDEGVAQALAGWRPNVTAQGQLEASDTKTNFAADHLWTRGVALDLNQNLYNGGGTVAGINQAESLVQAARANLLAVEQSTLLDTTNVYTTVWQNQAVLDLAENNADRLNRQLKATRDRFEVGEIARTDVAQAQARQARSVADIEQARADLATALAAYRQVVGDLPKKLADPEVAPGLPNSLDEAQAMAADNPQLAAAMFALQASRDAVDVAKADLLPDLDLRGTFSYFEDATPTISEQRDAALGVVLSVPLYQGGAVAARVRAQRQNVQQQQKVLESSTRGIQRSATSAWETYRAANATIEALRSQARANQVALQGVQEEANVGQRTTLDVLDAEQELFISQVDLVRATATAVLASYQLKAAVGDLTVVGMNLPVEVYNPDAYYATQRNRLFGIDVDMPG